MNGDSYRGNRGLCFLFVRMVIRVSCFWTKDRCDGVYGISPREKRRSLIWRMYHDLERRDFGPPRWACIDEVPVCLTYPIVILIRVVFVSATGTRVPAVACTCNGWRLDVIATIEKPFFCTTRNKGRKSIELFSSQEASSKAREPLPRCLWEERWNDG